MQRAAQIAPHLSVNSSESLGPAVADRQAWQDFARRNQPLLKKAERFLGEPIPELPEKLYLQYFENGNRRGYEIPYNKRVERLQTFAAAAAATLEQRYLDALCREVEAILAERTWVMPAHDIRRRNFDGKLIDIDLGSARRGSLLAIIHSMFQEQLPQPLLDAIAEQVELRTITPFRIRLADPAALQCRWITWANNWNAVCLSQIVTAALALPATAQARAEIIAGAEQTLPLFLGGFTEDGYCSEGVSYWNYGFGYYIRLAEMLYQASGGYLNLYAEPIVAKIAAYPDLLEMAPGQYPAFSDTRRYPQPAAWIRNITAVRLLGKEPRSISEFSFFPNPLLPADAFSLPAGRAVVTGSAAGEQPASTPDPLRGWFPQAQVLTLRSGREPAAEHMSVALKGGHNNEFHNHNDVGQFVVAYRGRQPVLDSGSETYTANTFGPRRYEAAALNSYGHSVPVIAGELQRTGRDAAAEVVATAFSDEADEITLDLRRAYAVPALQRLQRHFRYERAGKGSLSVEDRVAFDSPQTFATAIISCGKIEAVTADSFTLRDGDSAVRIAIDAPQGQPFSISTSEFGTDPADQRLRVQIAFDEPVQEAVLRCTVTPL